MTKGDIVIAPNGIMHTIAEIKDNFAIFIEGDELFYLPLNSLRVISFKQALKRLNLVQNNIRR